MLVQLNVAICETHYIYKEDVVGSRILMENIFCAGLMISILDTFQLTDGVPTKLLFLY